MRIVWRCTLKGNNKQASGTTRGVTRRRPLCATQVSKIHETPFYNINLCCFENEILDFFFTIFAARFIKVLFLPLAACKNDSCLHGECVETINSHYCACYEGFYGERCEQGEKIRWFCTSLKFKLTARTWYLTISCSLCWQLSSATRRRWPSHIKAM